MPNLQVLDATGATQNLATGSGTGASGSPFISPAAAGIGTTADSPATDGTSSWSMISVLKGIFKTILNAALGIPIYDSYQAPVTSTWTNGTALNTAQAVNTAGNDTVVLTLVFTGSITAGVVTFEVYDGVNWVAIKGFRPDSYLSDGTYTLVSASGSRSWQFSVAGFTQFRTRLSTVITGTGSLGLTHIVSSAPDVSGVTVGLDPNQALPAGANALGTVGVTSLPAGRYTSAATITRPANVTAYTAGQVVGGVITFANAGPSAGGVTVLDAWLMPQISAIPSGMTSFRLHLYSATPGSAYGNAVTWDLPSGDRATYLGYIDLGSPALFGASTLYTQVQPNKGFQLTGTSVYGYLVTNGAYTPAANSENYQVALGSVAN